MGWLFLLLVTVYSVVLTGSHASVSPKAYWESKLPNTLLPQTIKHTLARPGGEDVTQDNTMTNLIDSNNGGYKALLSYRSAATVSNQDGGEDVNPQSTMMNLDNNNGGYKALLSYRKASAGSNTNGGEDVLPQTTMTNLIDFDNGGYKALLSYRKASTDSKAYGGEDVLRQSTMTNLIADNNGGYKALLSYRKTSGGSKSNGDEDVLPQSTITNLIDSNNGGYKALLSYRKASAGSKAYGGEDVLPPSTIDSNGGYKALLSYRKASASPNVYDASSAMPKKYIRLPSSTITQEPAILNANDITTPEGSNEFFVEEELKHGSKLNLVFKKGTNKALILPRGVANKIPFSSDKLQQIYRILSLDPASSEAHVLSERIELCEEPTIKGVEKQCVTSLESMVDFVISQVGHNVEALYTKLEKDHPNTKYTIQGVKKLTKHEHETVVCHKMGYPYAVFFCHGTVTIKSYMVSLVGDDGTKVEAIAACHKETNEFLENYMINVLKVTPGSTRVCHFPLADEDTIIWIAK